MKDKDPILKPTTQLRWKVVPYYEGASITDFAKNKVEFPSVRTHKVLQQLWKDQTGHKVWKDIPEVSEPSYSHPSIHIDDSQFKETSIEFPDL